MDIYITDLEIGNRLRLPMLPEKINVQTGAVFQSYDILAFGEVKLPAGENLTGFSWKGILPGKAREKAPFIKIWQDPKEIQSLWSVYRAKKIKLKLLITETPVNHDVYLDSYSVEYSSGYGDYNYQISFVQAKELRIYTEKETDINSTENLGTLPPLENKSMDTPRTEPPMQKTYTVQKGDTLWGIAQKNMGNGSKYPQIVSSNQPPLSADPNKIYPGQVLILPI